MEPLPRQVLMKQRAIKIALTTIVLVGAFSGLLYSTLQDGTEYYKHVEEVMDKPAAWYGKKLQLHGFVVPDSIMRRKDTLEYRFKVQGTPPRASQGGTIVVASY